MRSKWVQKRGRIGAVGSWMGGYYALAVGWCQTASERVDLLTAFNAKVQIEVPGFNRRETWKLRQRKSIPASHMGFSTLLKIAQSPSLLFIFSPSRSNFQFLASFSDISILFTVLKCEFNSKT